MRPMEWFILALFLIVFYALGSALWYLLKPNRKDSKKMAQALTWRITLCVIIFLLLLLGYSQGWLHPHALLGPPQA